MLVEATKVCRGALCNGREKPLSQFHNKTSSGDGKATLCKSCRRDSVRDCRFKSRAKYLWNDAKRRARQRGVAFLLDQDWFQQRLDKGKCEVTGIPFVMDEKRHPYMPSPDRIDADGPYSPDNCRLVIWFLNCAKNTMSDQDFRSKLLQVAEALREHN